MMMDLIKHMTAKTWFYTCVCVCSVIRSVCRFIQQICSSFVGWRWPSSDCKIL